MFSNVGLTGKVDAGGNLKLGSTGAGGGPVFNMTGTVSGSTLSNGSFTLTGHCTVQGTITGGQYPPLDGTYAGSLKSQVTGQSFTMSATLDQSSAPNSSGLLSLTGAVNVNGYPCISSASTPIDVGFVGDSFGVYPSQSPALGWTGVLSLDGRTLAIDYGFSTSGNCNQDYGSGTLALQ